MALIQRQGRPALDITPDTTPKTASWGEHFDEPMNPLNAARPERKGKPEVNGWTKEAYDTNQVFEVGESEND